MPDRCEWYELGRVEWRNGLPRPGPVQCCVALALPGTHPPRCSFHQGMVTLNDLLDEQEAVRRA